MRFIFAFSKFFNLCLLSIPIATHKNTVKYDQKNSRRSESFYVIRRIQLLFERLFEFVAKFVEALGE